MEKKCETCNKHKPLSEFFIGESIMLRRGSSKHCKECHASGRVEQNLNKKTSTQRNKYAASNERS